MRAQFSSSSGGGSGSGENAEFYFGGLPFTSWNGGNPVGGGTIQYTGTKMVKLWYLLIPIEFIF
ncbi:MAG: hypothetical protein CM15mV81_040 [uncultured marine virus]|nr:MAG: hypothetical protein CM15mV81_040 [uncultured marine virus]